MIIEKKNRIVYFFVYFTAQILYIYINTYLPVYFMNVSMVDVTKLALVLFTSYSFIFIKPIFALFVEYREYKEIGLNRKLLIIIGSFGALVSYIIFIISIELLMIFTLFLGINFGFTSIIDVTIDKFIVEQNKNNEIKQKNALFIQTGAIMGAIVPNIFYFILMSDKTSSGQWNLFFIAGIIAIIPLIPIVFIIQDNKSKEIGNKISSVIKVPISLNIIALMGIFIFLAYSNNLYNWILEPWALERVSNGIFSIFMILFILLNAIGLIIAGKVSHKYDRKMLLIMSCVVSGVLLAFAPYMNIYVFFALVSITQLLSGFFLISLTTLMIDVSQKRVLVFQIMASCAILAKVILIPLGTALSAVLSTEIIITIAGILLAIASVPVYFIDHENS